MKGPMKMNWEEFIKIYEAISYMSMKRLPQYLVHKEPWIRLRAEIRVEELKGKSRILRRVFKPWRILSGRGNG